MASGINSYPGREYPSSSFGEESNKKSKCILNKINLKKYFNNKVKYSSDDGEGSKLNARLNFFKRRQKPISSGDDRSIFSSSYGSYGSDGSDVRSLSDSDINNIINKDEKAGAYAERIQRSINSFSRKNNAILIEKGKYSENDVSRIMGFLQMEYYAINKNAKGKKDAYLYKNVKVIANYKVLDGKECYEIKIKKFFNMNERDKEEVDQTLGILYDVLKEDAEKKGNTDLLNKITGMRCRDAINLLNYVQDLNLNKANDSESINVPDGTIHFYKNNSHAIFERDVESGESKYEKSRGISDILCSNAGNNESLEDKVFKSVCRESINISDWMKEVGVSGSMASSSENDSHPISKNGKKSKKKGYVCKYTEIQKNPNEISDEQANYFKSYKRKNTEPVSIFALNRDKLYDWLGKINPIRKYVLRKEKRKNEREQALKFMDKVKFNLKSYNIKNSDKLDWENTEYKYNVWELL